MSPITISGGRLLCSRMISTGPGGITLEPAGEVGSVYLLLAGGEEALGDLLLRGEAPLEKRIP